MGEGLWDDDLVAVLVFIKTCCGPKLKCLNEAVLIRVHSRYLSVTDQIK